MGTDFNAYIRNGIKAKDRIDFLEKLSYKTGLQLLINTAKPSRMENYIWADFYEYVEVQEEDDNDVDEGSEDTLQGVTLDINGKQLIFDYWGEYLCLWIHEDGFFGSKNHNSYFTFLENSYSNEEFLPKLSSDLAAIRDLVTPLFGSQMIYLLADNGVHGYFDTLFLDGLPISEIEDIVRKEQYRIVALEDLENHEDVRDYERSPVFFLELPKLKFPISHLSFSTEFIQIDDGYLGTEEYLSFTYSINGKEIKEKIFDYYNPIDWKDVLDKDAASRNLVILMHCTCGIWECSSLVANVDEDQEGLVHWAIGELSAYDIVTPRELEHHYFNKEEYFSVMKAIRQKAEEESKR